MGVPVVAAVVLALVREPVVLVALAARAGLVVVALARRGGARGPEHGLDARLVPAVQRPGDEAGGALQVLAALLLARLYLLVHERGEARADALQKRLVAR